MYRVAQSDTELLKTVSLVGLMGSGKTTVGRRLAHTINVDFKDSDAEIEHAAGMDISDIFATYDEAYFRRGEQRVIQRIIEGSKPLVLATGGGAFIQEETRHVLQKDSVTVWLKADLDTLVKRTARRDTRPLLNTGDPRQILERLSNERNPIYAQADIVIDSCYTSLDETVDIIIKELVQHGSIVELKSNVI